MVMLRRILRSRMLYICGAALILSIALFTILRVASLSHPSVTDAQSDDLDGHQGRNPLATDLSAADASPEAVQKVVLELLRIKKSVKKELAELEARRALRLKELQTYSNEQQRLRVSLSRSMSEVQQMQLSIISLKAHQDEIEKRNLPILRPPLLTMDSRDKVLRMDVKVGRVALPSCSIHSCFDYRHCGITSQVFISVPTNASLLNDVASRSSFTVSSKNQRPVCLSVGFSVSHCAKKSGLNCVVIDSNGLFTLPGEFKGVRASPSFRRTDFRPGFDVIMPAAAYYTSGELWSHLQRLLPARRRYLLSFMGIPPTGQSDLDRTVAQTVNNLAGDKFEFQLTCRKVQGVEADWELCGTFKSRTELLKQSTFALVVSPPGYSDNVSSIRFQRRLYESLMSGAIPVVLGDALLPLDEMIEWSRCVIRLAKQRVTELHFLLRTIPDSDIVEMRRRCRMIMETYLGSTERQWTSLLHLLGRRIGLAAPPAKDFKAVSAFIKKKKVKTYEVSNQFADIDDYLGPTDESRDSTPFQRNFSAAWTDASIARDSDPFHRYPFSPWRPVLPTESQFKQSSFGFRPINHQEEGAGVEFSKALGGNKPYEQYTIVLLTYKRETVLMDTLTTFKGLPYLHSVVVVWNSPDAPSDSLKWPRLEVPIHVVRGRGNSLNNRFLPFDIIKTEAILSIDDDVTLRQDEIVFGFRAWREQRHKLVGFPARYHQWSSESQRWLYNSNYSCEYSMILTGAAFFHKYYSYLYSSVMPEIIRLHVDRIMNCEDLAMNFLISHVTREPPIKVTSRWTFRCPLCQTSLYFDKSHFSERSECIKILTDVYGYNPLLYSQFRLDSVLFKTRIPSDKRKCFKYV